MNRSILALLVIALAPAAARAEINLTPKPSVRELDGVRFPQLEFADDTATITYEAPRGWTYTTDSPRRLVLRPQDKVQADANIEFVKNAQPTVFDDAGVKRLKDEFPALLPKDSEQIAFAGEGEKNPLQINGHETYELTANFALFGRKFTTSVLFVDMGDSQLRFILSCQTRDFAELHKAFQRSWYSWQWVPQSQAHASR
jgi:hypothetical protein